MQLKCFLVMTLWFIQSITVTEHSWAKSFTIEPVNHSELEKYIVRLTTEISSA